MVRRLKAWGLCVALTLAEHEMQIVERRAGVVVLCRCAGER